MSSKYIKGYTDKITNKYIKDNYDQFSLRVPKGDREKYKKMAEIKGKSLNGLIVELLDAEYNRVQEDQINRVATYAKHIYDSNQDK